MTPAEPTFRPDELPLAVRAYNRAHRWLEELGLGTRGFDEARLIARARRRTGLSDLGLEFGRPLRRLLEALEHESELSAFGRATMRAYCVDALERRLRIEQTFREHPAIDDERISAPLFIVGLPRTGSTHLHHLLCADPSVRAPLFWQLRWPTPPPDRELAGYDPRIRRAERVIRRGLRAIPELALLHAHEAEGPEECQLLFDASFMNPLLPAGDRYERWWREQDLVFAYRYYERQLKLLQWRWHAEPWVLKAPFHLWHLDALSAVFPDARFVFTHRDPVSVVPSAASYAALRGRTYFERLDPHALGLKIMNDFADMLETGLRHRGALDPARFADVAYRELLEDPLGVATRARHALGHPVSSSGQSAMQRYLDAHPQHKHGVHRYAPEQFGLTAEAIRERFASYLEFSAERGMKL